MAVLFETAVMDPVFVLETAGSYWLIRGLLGSSGAQNMQITISFANVLSRWLDCPVLRTNANLDLVLQVSSLRHSLQLQQGQHSNIAATGRPIG